MTTAAEGITVQYPGWPLVRYSKLGATGHKVPTFALVFVPQTCTRHADYVQLTREPGESGPTFHARAMGEALRHVVWRNCQTEQVEVMFIDALPRREWREDWRQRARLRWHLTCGQSTAEERIAFADELLELIGMAPAGAKVTR